MLDRLNRLLAFLKKMAYRLSPKKKLKRKYKKVDPDIEKAGQWYYLRDILGRLKNHFTYLKKMRRNDPKGYALYSKIGGYIVGDKTMWNAGVSLNAAWRNGHRPAFGMLATPEMHCISKDGISMRMGYFMKEKNPYFVQPHNGDVYRVVVYYVDNADTVQYPMTFYVGVDTGGEMRLLQNAYIKPQLIRSSRHGNSIIKHAAFGYPPEVANTAKEKEDTPQEWAQRVFNMIATTSYSASSGMHVRASKNNLTALFCVDMLRTPYFFKDRDLVVNENGNTKKIMHIVRTHKRITNGVEKYIKSHFRGLRKFMWGGYKVIISMPEKHHAAIGDFSEAGHDEKDLPKRSVSLEGMTEALNQHLTQ